MKRFKMTIVFTLCFVLFFQTAIPFVSAGSPETCASGAINEDLSYLTPELQYRNYCSTVSSKEQASLITSKYQYMMLSESERTRQAQQGITQTRSLYEICSLPVTPFRQERNYWCGPATTKQTIHYLSGGTNSPTQSQIASYIGTTTAGSSSTRMASWLATQGYQYYSVSASSMTGRDLINYVATDLSTYNTPPFGGVAIGSGDLKGSDENCGWLYTTGGHFLNISELWRMEPDYENSMIYVTDPYIPWVYPSMTGYFVTTTQYMDVITSFWW